MSPSVDLNRTAPPMRKIASAVVVLVGIVLIVSTFTNNLFSVGTDFEEMIDDFRPALEEESIAAAQADLVMLEAVGTEFQTAIVPALSQQLGMTETEFVGFTQTNFPDVADGIAALPEIVPTFNGLLDTLDSQRDLFESADAIPTKSLPATTVPWGLFLTGVGLVLVGALLFKPGWLALALSGAFGVGILAATLTLSLIPKASDADQLNENLRPVYTPELVAQANASLATVGAMGTQMQAEMLPALAQQLGMSGEELNGFLGQNFPATASALQALPDAMGRFGTLTTIFNDNLDNYETVEPVGFSPIIWTLFIGGVATLAAFALAWRASNKSEPSSQLSTRDNKQIDLSDSKVSRKAPELASTIRS